ncbi:MAG: permease [Gracilibacteraceae bacterium]|nr:permease [Gracilibacteraceae bacterium]
MIAPVYVLTGFLSAGKTSFLNSLLARSDWRNIRILVIQFENGEEELSISGNSCKKILFPLKELERQPKEIARQIRHHLREGNYDEIWIEWNGIIPLAQLQSLLSLPLLRSRCKIRRVVHIADAAELEKLLGRTGKALPEQIANSDFALIRNETAADAVKIRKLLRAVNPGLRAYSIESYDDFYRQLLRKTWPPLSVFIVAVILLSAVYLVAAPPLTQIGLPLNKIVNVFLGIILQATPFLLVGVLISGAVEIFISRAAIESRFPKTNLAGMMTAVMAGFCLPVCDCATIPVFHGLVRKGIPLPAAVTFMTAAPVINPVVIFSTYYAFNGNMRVVALRVILGLAAALAVGVTFVIFPPKKHIMTDNSPARAVCESSYWEIEGGETDFLGKISLLFRHAQIEFFNMGKFLAFGSFVSAVLQTVAPKTLASSASGGGLILSLLIMMSMGFLLSLCSSSDAVIARAFASQFPPAALMGFMIFGPMMDIKNALMLSSVFSGRFIARLTFTAFAACFALVLLYAGAGGMY